MRTKPTVLYQFDELSEAAKTKAIEAMRDINTDHDWSEFSREYWQDDKLPELGFDNAQIAFSGFWSQGDGASFTATVNAGKFIKAHKLTRRFRRLVNILQHGWSVIGRVYRTSHHYSHEYTVTTEMETDYYSDNTKRQDRVETQVKELEEIILSEVRDLSRQIYRELEKEYEYLVSDEAIAETIRSNEYEFDKNGNQE